LRERACCVAGSKVHNASKSEDSQKKTSKSLQASRPKISYLTLQKYMYYTQANE